ncbi:MAG: type II toxin-antitoxin system VapC family toxin [Gemmatimonadota bacterium]
MALRVSVDTTFLIDLQRERSRGEREGPARRFLLRNPDAELHLSVVALGEYTEGFPSADHPIVQAVRAQHALLVVDEETALVYAHIVRELRTQGTLIGANDLWIGSSSLRHHLPVLTANVGEFHRIAGLQVIDYRLAAASEERG